MTGAGSSTSRAEQRRMTQARILRAAAALFVELGYERATIRAIAAAAEVDPGLVMHYFGTKDELFRQVTDGNSPGPLSGSPEQVIEQILARMAASIEQEPVQSLAVLRSMLTHPEAAEAASKGSASYRAQLSAAIPAPDAALRAALINATILGVIVSRHLLPTDELQAATPGQVIDLIRPGLRALACADPPAAVRPPAPGRPRSG